MKNTLLLLFYCVVLHSGAFAQKAAPSLRIGSFTLEEAGIDDNYSGGVYCDFHKKGTPESRVVFLEALKSYIKVNGKLMMIKDTEKGFGNTGKWIKQEYLNDRYKVITTTFMAKNWDGGTLNRGTMTVIDRKTGQKVSINIEGGCVD